MTIKQDFLIKHNVTGEYIADAHLHSGNISTFITKDFDWVISHMERLGISAGVVSDINEYEGGNDNNLSVETIADKNKFWGAVYLCPDRMDMQAELERCAGTGRFTGVKLHPVWNAREVDDPCYFPIHDMAGQLSYPVLIHTWGVADIRRMEQLAKQFPKTNFLAGHCGGALDASMLAGEMAANHENFYLDYTCSAAYANLLEYYVKTCGSEKVVFGSDALWNSIDAALGRVIFTDIPDDDKRNVLGLNAKRIYLKL